MEDEEGYTALQFQRRRNPEDRCEDVPRADPQAPHSQIPARWIIVLLMVLVVLLVLAVIGSGFWNFKLQQENRDLRMSLKQRDTCDDTNKSGADPMPSLPLKWQQRGRKCYYFPVRTDVKNWNASQKDCSSRGSHLVVIEDKAELDYLTSELTNQAWIGLFITPARRGWTWVNGSTLNEHVFNVTGSADVDWCGVVNSGSILSTRCINSFYWICQKEVENCNSGV
ncbi:killer cell lectin-like receptor subfamily B member 1A isoform X2 [Lissotriton helveticus]